MFRFAFYYDLITSLSRTELKLRIASLFVVRRFFCKQKSSVTNIKRDSMFDYPVKNRFAAVANICDGGYIIHIIKQRCFCESGKY